MKSKKIILSIFLIISFFSKASDNQQFKKSLCIPLATYTALSVLDTLYPMKSIASSDLFTCMGGLACCAAVVANNDICSGTMAIVLIGFNMYVRSFDLFQEEKELKFLKK